MRKALDALYDGAAWLAALFMIALLVAVLLSIAGRQLHFHVKGTDAYAGYFMAAAGFLAGAFLPVPRAARASRSGSACSSVTVSGLMSEGRVAFTPSWLT